MEEIRFVETPRCTVCKPDVSFRRRRSCTGCEKLLPRPVYAKRHKKHAVRRKIGPETARQVLLLRAQGRSYGEIACELGLPRPTVQGVVRRCAAVKSEGEESE